MPSKSGGDLEQSNIEVPTVRESTIPTSQVNMTSAQSTTIVTPTPVPVVSSQPTAAKVPPENLSARRHTVATNIEGLKLELQKIHTPSVPSVNLKSNIEQGLQAIFSMSSGTQTVTTPAHSTTYNHTHQLLSTSTPSLNTPVDACLSAIKTPTVQPPSSLSVTSIGNASVIFNNSKNLCIFISSIILCFCLFIVCTYFRF